MFCFKRFFFRKILQFIWHCLTDGWSETLTAETTRERLNARIQLIHHSTTKKDERTVRSFGTKSAARKAFTQAALLAAASTTSSVASASEARWPTTSWQCILLLLLLLRLDQSSKCHGAVGSETKSLLCFPRNLRMVFLSRDDGDVNILRNVPNVVCCDYYLV